jgi:phosphinothricin acetyltransferase
MNIRLAQRKDLAAINEIYNQAVRKKYCTADLDEITISERKLWFEAHEPQKYPVFVAEKDNIIVGWLSFSPYRPGRRALQSALEISYYLHEDYQQQGIGSLLLQYAIDVGANYGARNLFAILLEPNVASIRLLQKFGFTQWAKLPAFAEIDGEFCAHLYFGLSINRFKIK